MHWYGKEPQLKRKLGHITIVAPDNATARQRLRAIDSAAADAMQAASSTPAVSQGGLFLRSSACTLSICAGVCMLLSGMHHANTIWHHDQAAQNRLRRPTVLLLLPLRLPLLQELQAFKVGLPCTPSGDLQAPFLLATCVRSSNAW